MEQSRVHRAGAARRRVTSTDVANEAGLSRATVSFVLNDAPNQTIPEVTRRRVWDAARKLGYMPSAAARTLRTGRSEVVLFVLPDTPVGPALVRVTERLAGLLDDAGLTMLTVPRTGGRSGRSVWSRVTPDAVLTFEAFSDGERALLEQLGIEHVVDVSMSGDLLAGQDGSIDTRIGRLQAGELLAGGRRIGVVSPADPRLQRFAVPRRSGAEEACADAGVECMNAVMPLTPDGARTALAELGCADGAVTGICAYNDEYAMALLAAARDSGLTGDRRPAVIGVDDIPTAPFADPPLTTVVLDVDEVAGEIAAEVIERLTGTEIERSPRPEGMLTLVRRESA
ncbi:LacI family DNA-binding transcriptional regulator [Tsukamurella soli]|uniref:LacI family DNA-binding transcriptional regulator n=1 Tax=Tsukamurella soli TaxID=644556 RepID=A0ABP8JID9_9ACTN